MPSYPDLRLQGPPIDGDIEVWNGTTGTWALTQEFAAGGSAAAVFSVKEFGARGNGVTDDSAAVTSAGNAAVASGGILFFPPGIYICNNVFINPSYGNSPTLIARGCGRDTSILKATITNTPAVITFQGNIVVEDLTVDGNTLAQVGLSCITPAGHTCEHVSLVRVRCQNIIATGFWVCSVFGQSANSNNIANCWLYDVEWFGPANVTFDGAAIAGVVNCFIDGLTINNLGRPNFYQITTLLANNLVMTNSPDAIGPTIDVLCQTAECTNWRCDTTSPPTLNTPSGRFTNCQFDATPLLNKGANAPNHYFVNCQLPGGLSLENAMGSLTVTGGQLGSGYGAYILGLGSITDYSAAATVHGPIILTAVTLASVNRIVLSYSGSSGPIQINNCNGYSPGRSIYDAVLNGTTTLTSATAQFSADDVGRTISDSDNIGLALIPANTTISSVSNATTVIMSHAATGSAGAGTDVVYMGGHTITLAFNAFTPTAGSFVRSTPGYNPVGVVTPAVPLTTVAVAAQPYDRTFYITTGAGSTYISIGGGSNLTLNASAFNAVTVPAGQTLTPTYTNAPTWIVYGN